MHKKNLVMLGAVFAFIVLLTPGIADAASPPEFGTHTFLTDLTMGAKGDEVIALQKFLVTGGYLVVPKGVPMGYFGTLTKNAVIKWQKAKGIRPSLGYVGPKSRAILGATATPAIVASSGAASVAGISLFGYVGISVTLDASSPLPRSIISGSAAEGVTTLAVFKFTNTGTSPAKITIMKLRRTGVSSDTTLAHLYLYDAQGVRLTDAVTVSSGNLVFSDNNGLITIPAGNSVVVAVRGDIAVNQSGQTIGLLLTDITTDTSPVSGLPLAGAEHRLIASPADMATFSFGAATTPASGTMDPASDTTLWQNTVTVGGHDVLLSTIRFEQLGTVSVADVKHLRLTIDGVQVGQTIVETGADRSAFFRFSPPVAIKTGAHVMKLVGDVGGTNRNFEFSLRRAADIEVLDGQLNVAITPLLNNASFTPVDGGGTVTINVGTLSWSKDTASPSGGVVKNASGALLAKFKLKGQGEDLKLEKLRVSFTAQDSALAAKNAVGSLRNGKIFFDGTQIGSTQTLCEDSGTCASTGYTEYNFGSSVVIAPGTEHVIEVRADTFDNDGSDSLVDGDMVTVNLVAGSSNVYRMSSLSYTANTALSANPITITTGSLTLAKYTAYAAQTATVPARGFKIGDYRLTTGSVEGAHITTFSFDLSGSDASKLESIYVVYGGKTSAIKARVSSSTNLFSVNESLPANSMLSVAIFATLPSSMNIGDTVTTLLTVSGTSETSGETVASSQTTGQQISVDTSSLTASLDAGTPVSANVSANSMQKVASFKWTSLHDAFTITELTAKLNGNENDMGAIKNIVWKDGETIVATQPVVPEGGIIAATSSGLSVAIPMNGSKVIDAYADIGQIGTGFATTSANVGITLDGYEAQDSNGVRTRNYADLVGNNFYAFKGKPSISLQPLPTTVLSNGAMVLARFTITVDGAPIAWNKFVFRVTSGGTATVTPTTWALRDDGGQTGGTAGVLSGETLSFTRGSTDKELAVGTKTYMIVGTVTDVASGSSVSVQYPSGASSRAVPVVKSAVASAATLIWSDLSIVGHSRTTADWMDDYLVKGLPADSQTTSR